MGVHFALSPLCWLSKACRQWLPSPSIPFRSLSWAVHQCASNNRFRCFRLRGRRINPRRSQAMPRTDKRYCGCCPQFSIYMIDPTSCARCSCAQLFFLSFVLDLPAQYVKIQSMCILVHLNLIPYIILHFEWGYLNETQFNELVVFSFLSLSFEFHPKRWPLLKPVTNYIGAMPLKEK